MSRDDELSRFQDKIGWRFSDLSLLERALTHSSVSAGREGVRDLERLEFLGDRVLGLMTAEELWRRYPTLSEGELAPRLNALVRKDTCAAASRMLGLGPLLLMTHSEEAAGGRDRATILGDACEALLGGLYIDGGLKAAQLVFSAFWLPNFESLAVAYRDAKTELQEWAQAHKRGTPVYKVIDFEGPDHAPTFTVQAHVEGVEETIGVGGSKREAQTAAAEAMLLRENVWPK